MSAAPYDVTGGDDILVQREREAAKHRRVVVYFVACFKNSMSGIQPFQFEPTHTPGEEPIDSEEESQEEESVPNLTTRIGNIEWCICGGNCESMSTAEECHCCQELEELNSKFDEAGLSPFV